MTFTRNFALQGNVGDLVAKDDSQMSVAHLLGMMVGVSTLTLAHAPLFLFGMFAVIVPVHFSMTLALLRAASFEVLTQTTLCVLSHVFVDKGVVLDLNGARSWTKWFGEWVDRKSVVSVDLAAEAKTLTEINDVLSVLKDENYLLSIPASSLATIRIPLHTSAGPEDVIRATLHATRFHHELFTSSDDPRPAPLAALKSSHEWVKLHFTQFLADIESQGWKSDAIFYGDSGRRVEWPRDTQYTQGAA
ncbi:hypothetical protein HKX48_004098 [Thoreauomyces humboldtii]|nr:hypothetical protein HKX48_004098 [Thoreauomyces humboldtii]